MKIKKILSIILLITTAGCSLFTSGKDSYERQFALSEDLQKENEHNHVAGEHPLENIEITSEEINFEKLYDFCNENHFGAVNVCQCQAVQESHMIKIKFATHANGPRKKKKLTGKKDK